MRRGVNPVPPNWRLVRWLAPSYTEVVTPLAAAVRAGPARPRPPLRHRLLSSRWRSGGRGRAGPARTAAASGVTTSVYDGANHLTSRQFGGTGLTPLRIDFSYNAANLPDTATRYS